MIKIVEKKTRKRNPMRAVCCLSCKNKISLNRLKLHLKTCNGKIKNQPRKIDYSHMIYSKIGSDLVCNCGKICDTLGNLKLHYWRKHSEDGKKFIPTPTGTKIAWNKGLTKENNKSLKLSSETYQQRKAQGLYKPRVYSLEARLNLSNKTKEWIKNNPGRLGGANGGGKGCKGVYRGIRCDSSWELAYVLYNIDRGISFVRNKEKFLYYHQNSPHYYTPDFIENGIYIEVKGYDRNSHLLQDKISQFPHELKLLRYPEMEPLLNYVINKFGKNFTDLYDNKIKKEYIDRSNRARKFQKFNEYEKAMQTISIDFSKKRWIPELAAILGCSRNIARRFIKERFPEIFKIAYKHHLNK